MVFLARYIPLEEGKPYYYTLYANTLLQASNQAEKYRKKGYQLSTVTEAR